MASEASVCYTQVVRSFTFPEIPEKLEWFLVPGVLVFTALLIAGGFYFRQRSLNLTSQTAVLEVPEEEGEVSGARTTTPESFPRDIPLFEPSELLSSMESKERIQITLQTDGSAERVRRFYQQEMEDLGWKLTGRGMANENGVLTFKKGERNAQIVITSDPTGPTLIVLNTNL